MERDRYLITCEHGGNDVPPRYRHLLEGMERRLGTHEGYDPGALAMAEALANTLAAPLVASTTTRLLIELNRSLGHPRLYSEAARKAPPSVRRDILEEYYLPYRQRIERYVEDALATGDRIVHVSSHSFTPELDGEVRHADIGLLYDPKRTGELALCKRWETAIGRRDPSLRVRRNYPYAGTADGLTTALRRKYAAPSYVGIELEVNQRFVLHDMPRWEELRDIVIGALQAARGVA